MLVVCLIIGGFGLVFAQDARKVWSSAPQTIHNADLNLPAEMSFTGDEIVLSLDQVIQRAVTQGSAARTAAINQDKNEAIADGYDEADAPLADLAAEQAKRNNTAEINAVKRDAVKKYYESIQARDAVRILTDNVAAQEAILNNIRKKYDQGMLTKLDLLKAESTVSQARADLKAGQSAYSLVLMALNQYLGFPVMQNTVLTETLTVEAPDLKPLAEAVSAAKNNRNEIFGANYAKQAAKYALSLLEAQGLNDDFAAYRKAEAALDAAKKMVGDAPAQIEMDVRGKYMQVQTAEAAANASQLALQKAEEALRVARLSQDAGLVTASDVQLAQLGCCQAALQYSKSLLTYKLAIKDYELSYTTGTYVVPMSTSAS